MNAPLRLSRSIIRVSGADAVSFLNNLLTQDVEKLEQTPVQYAALLTPQGKVIADMLLWAHEGAILIECDPARGADLLRRLTMYKLRAHVAIEDVSADYVALHDVREFEGSSADPRFPQGWLGWRHIARASGTSYENGDASYDTRRLLVGAPDLVRDAGPEEVFALEALLEELHAVAFDKGCFVGQENVSRMKRRATTRKKFCVIVFEAPPPAPATPLLAGATEIGTVRTGHQSRAIALLRLDRALEAQRNGVPLTAGGKTVYLQPQEWLILPQREAPDPGARD